MGDSMPDVAAGETHGLVHAEHGTALGAGPAEVLFGDKDLNANFLNTQEVGNGTGAIFCSITLIEVLDPLTREIGTVETVFDASRY